MRQLESDPASQVGAPSVVPPVSRESSINQVIARRVQALATPPEQGQLEDQHWVMALSVPVFSADDENFEETELTYTSKDKELRMLPGGEVHGQRMARRIRTRRSQP